MGDELVRGDIDALRAGLSREVFDSLAAGVVVQTSDGQIVRPTPPPAGSSASPGSRRRGSPRPTRGGEPCARTA
jgi:hypothetical protein